MCVFTFRCCIVNSGVHFYIDSVVGIGIHLRSLCVAVVVLPIPVEYGHDSLLIGIMTL